MVPAGLASGLRVREGRHQGHLGPSLSTQLKGAPLLTLKGRAVGRSGTETKAP